MRTFTQTLKFFFLACALVLASNVSLQAAITATVNRSTLTENFNSNTHSVSWTVHPANHVTFTLVGDGLKKETWLGEDYFYLSGNLTVNREYNLTWQVNSKDPNGNSAYSIKVTKLVFDIDRASGRNTYLKVGNGAKTDNLYHASNIPSGGVASGTMNEGENGSIRTIFYKPATYSQISVNNIKVTYTLVPLINYTNDKSVAVTVCDDHKQFLNLSECASLADQSGHISLSYSLRGDNASDARIEDGKFYAYKVGTYTIRASVAAVTGCHDANTQDFTVTVTPVTLSLTAPTASDITYRQALTASNLKGGAAKVGSCVVDGSWAWKASTTVPSMPGDDQPFPVVFTPSENAGNYTGFETTALVDVKRAQFVFNGSGTEADDPNHVTWCYDDNWEENQKPGSEDKVLIDHNVVIRQEVSVYSVTINEGDTLTIMPTGGLTVGAGGIIGATTGNLILKAGTEGETKGQTGYLRISPESAEPMPEATVELYSIGYYNMGEAEHNAMASWQFVGVPMVGGQSATSVFRVSFIYNWDETNDAWENNRSSLILQPFAGYATSQYFFKDGMLITNAGQLVPNTGITEIELDYSGVGHNVVANSFTAPIDITKFDDEDFENAEKVIYLFNTGSKNDVKAIEETKNAASSYEAKGQFIPIPVGSASSLKKAFPALPTSIAPMQGFCVNATGDEAKIKLDYKKLVWEGASKNTPLRVKARDEETSLNGALCVSISAKGWSDNLYLIESNDYSAEYENGFDATKRMSGSLNVFAVEGDVNLSVDATNSIAGTRVGVRTGEEMTYTMNFSHVNSENPLVLWDKEAQFKMLISEDLEYTFNAEPNSEITERFQIIAADIPAVTTGVDEVESEVHIQKFIKDNQLYILKDGVLYNASGAVVRK